MSAPGRLSGNSQTMETFVRNMIVAALAAALLLTACTEGQKDDTFAIACTAVSTADVSFQLYASSGKVKPSVIEAERKAVIAAQAVCNGPRPANVRDALAAVNRALAAIAAATAQARVQAI